MSDTQYKTNRDATFRVAEGNYAPNLPIGTIEMVNDKYKQWLIRRGFASEESLNTFKGPLRGASKRSAALKKIKKKSETTTTVQDNE